MRNLITIFLLVSAFITSHSSYSETLSDFLKSIEQEEKKIKSMADKGDAVAQYELAEIYRQKDNANELMDEIVNLYTKSASGGNAKSQYRLAQAYIFGLTGKISEEKSYFWIKKSADKGFRDAQRDLGLFKILGLGTSKNELEGVELIRKASAQGDGLALKLLNEETYRVYREYSSYSEDLVQYSQEKYSFDTYRMNKIREFREKYFKYIEKAHRFAKVITAEGEAYSLKEFNPSIDLWEPMYFKILSSYFSLPHVYIELGRIYSEGNEIVDRNIEFAISYFNKAVALNDREAMYELSKLLIKRGVKDDLVNGMHLLINASRAGYTDAHYELGKMYVEGKLLKKDIFEGIKFMNLSAQNGHIGAMSFLANAYLNGKGVRRDISKAKDWFGLACDNRDESACDIYAQLDAGQY